MSDLKCPVCQMGFKDALYIGRIDGVAFHFRCGMIHMQKELKETREASKVSYESGWQACKRGKEMRYLDCKKELKEAHEKLEITEADLIDVKGNLSVILPEQDISTYELSSLVVEEWGKLKKKHDELKRDCDTWKDATINGDDAEGIFEKQNNQFHKDLAEIHEKLKESDLKLRCKSGCIYVCSWLQTAEKERDELKEEMLKVTGSTIDFLEHHQELKKALAKCQASKDKYHVAKKELLE